MNKFIRKIEEILQKKIFEDADETVVSEFLAEIINRNNEYKIPEKIKDFLFHCSVTNFYELETEKILIRFSNINDLIEENLKGILLNQGFFIFADNSDCDIFFIDLTINGNYEVYIGSRDLLCDEEGITFYKKGIQKLEFSYENIKNMSIKIADNFSHFIEKFLNEEDMSYDVVRYVVDRFTLDKL